MIAGVDEVGRGPLAGNVVASAVILLDDTIVSLMQDSKKLSAKKRESLSEIIRQHSHWAIGEASVEEIDELNIFQATMLAMTRAIQALPVRPERLLIDGTHAPKIDLPCQCLIKGDEREPVIGAASIVAKVVRDEQMNQLGQRYPQYGFEQHKGYGTKYHMEALKQHGVTPYHRRSFKPVRALLETV